MKIALLLLIIVIWSPGLTLGCSQTCPNGWSKSGTRCYKYFANRKTADEAEADCVSSSAHLTSINSGSEQSFVYNLWRNSLVSHTPAYINVNTMNSLWIGAKRKQVRNRWIWTWTDGSSWSHTKWENTYGNQPDGTGNCAHMWTHSRVQPPGGWNDLYCDSSMYKTYYVCERAVYNACGGGGGGGGGGGRGDYPHHL